MRTSSRSQLVRSIPTPRDTWRAHRVIPANSQPDVGYLTDSYLIINVDERDERSMYRGRQVADGPGKTDLTATIVREEDATWMAQGSCRGMNPSVFFPSDGAGFEAAQRICMECPVRAECLEYALANRIEQGAWGGTSERERRRILRRRRALKLENEFVLARSGPVDQSSPVTTVLKQRES